MNRDGKSTLELDRETLAAKRQMVGDWRARRIDMTLAKIHSLQQEIRELEQALRDAGVSDA
jgi:hypothetical protein